jgi:hypothetical protein
MAWPDRGTATWALQMPTTSGSGGPTVASVGRRSVGWVLPLVSYDVNRFERGMWITPVSPWPVDDAA